MDSEGKLWWPLGRDNEQLHVKLPLHTSTSVPSRNKFTWKPWLYALLILLSYIFVSGHSELCAQLLGGIDRRPRIQGSQNPAYLIEADNGAVAAENKRCSDIGVQVLKDGGNAVDAAISAAFCTGVVNMFSSGIGGGGFMIVRIPSAAKGLQPEVYTVDFRETAPALANSSMFIHDPEAAKFGSLAVGVPGEVRGLSEAHKRWGLLPWRRLMEPSIQLAKGWEVDRELARRIPWFSELMLNNPDWRAIFAPNGSLLKYGETIQRTNLSRTLSMIAEEGPDAFYEGPIADSIVRRVRSLGGILSHSDLRNYSVKIARALQGTYRGRTVYTTHPPTSGPVLLHMLNILELYDMEKRTGLNTHRAVEILKYGFAARTKICDPAFTNDTARMDQIIQKSFARLVKMNITDDRTHTPSYYNPEYDTEDDHGTSHTSVVDKNGMAVSLTSTINLVFGSQVLDPHTGIILNDEMDDFSTPGVPNGFGLWPSPYNYPEPGKRPLSSTVPTIIEDNDNSLTIIGASGGSRIFGAVFQTLMNLGWELDASEAVEFGRVHDQLYPQILDIDNTYPPELIDSLRRRGHNVTVSDINRVAAVVQLVYKTKDKIFAASDSRKNGIAAGY